MAKKWIGYIGVGSLMCAALGCGILYTRQARLQQTISDKVLRFHVLANSDSEADQNLKLAVRDAVGSFMQEKLWKRHLSGGRLRGTPYCDRRRKRT